MEGVIVLRLIDPGGDRPHPHRLGRERAHQVARVRLVTQPAGVVAGREDQRHTIVNLGDQLVSVRCRLLGSLLSLGYQLGQRFAAYMTISKSS